MNNQQMIRVLVLEGESRLAKDCYLIKELKIENLTPKPAGQVRVCLEFNIDSHNVLTVSLSEQGSDQNQVFSQIDL